MKVKLNL
jgi:hypothetical protein